MRKTLLILALLCFGLICCGDDDEMKSRVYSVNYKVTASDQALVKTVQYRDERGELIIVDRPDLPWEISLTIPGGKALEAAAIADLPFDQDLAIEATFGEVGGSMTTESEMVKNDDQGTVILNAQVDIDGRTLPR